MSFKMADKNFEEVTLFVRMMDELMARHGAYHRLMAGQARDGAEALAGSLAEHREEAQLYKRLATLRTDAPVFQNVAELRWRGPTADFERVARHLGAPALLERARRDTP